MAFGRDTERRLFDLRPHLARLLAADPARMELVDAAALREQAAVLGLSAAQGPAADRGEAMLLQATLLLEHGLRTGAAEDLAKAARLAEKAAELLPTEAAGPAGLAVALASLLAAEQFGVPAALDSAEQRLVRLADEAPADEAAVITARRLALEGRVAAARALLAGDIDLGVAAAARCDRAVAALDRLADRFKDLRPEAALARVARAELLTAFASRLREAALAAQAADDLAQVSDRLDPDETPVTFARVEIARGEALVALGELNGDAAALAEAVAALTEALDALPPGWSPVDRARAARAHGLARQALAEATEEAALFDQAAESFELALVELNAVGDLPLRAVCAFDRAMALARRAERLHDPRALDWAEGALKARLVAHDPAGDPVAWASLQVALARIYTVQGQARGDAGGGAQAALALEAAVDVFIERGLKTLAEQALSQRL